MQLLKKGAADASSLRVRAEADFVDIVVYTVQPTNPFTLFKQSGACHVRPVMPQSFETIGRDQARSWNCFVCRIQNPRNRGSIEAFLRQLNKRIAILHSWAVAKIEVSVDFYPKGTDASIDELGRLSAYVARYNTMRPSTNRRFSGNDHEVLTCTQN